MSGIINLSIILSVILLFYLSFYRSVCFLCIILSVYHSVCHSFSKLHTLYCVPMSCQLTVTETLAVQKQILMQQHHLIVIEGSARGCEYICGTCVSSSRRRQLLNFNALWDYFVREENSFLIKFLSKAWFCFTPPFLSRQKLENQMFILCVWMCYSNCHLCLHL